MRAGRTWIVALVFSLGAVGLWAQGRTIGPDWPAARADAQLTSWQRNDPNISVATLSKPGFELQWKERVETPSRGGRALGQAITINGVNLFMPVSLIVGDASRIFAIDNDTGFVLWQRQFEAPAGAPSAACPGGITGAAARMVSAVPPALVAAPGGGRGGRGYQSLMGQPGEGAPIDAPRGGGGGRAGAPGAPTPQPARGGAGAGGAGTAPTPGPAAGRAGAPPARGGGGGGLGRLGGPAYVVSAGGTLHTVGWVNGVDIQKPAPFLPANARYSDAMAVNDSLYLTTSGNCGGAASGVWAVDLGSETKDVRSWKTNGGSPVGPLAFTTDGIPLVAIGAGQPTTGGYANAIVALDPKTLQPKDWFTHRTAEFVTAPMVFRQGSREIAAAATSDGRVLLLDARSLGGTNHSTPLHAFRVSTEARTPFAPRALAMWQETPTPGPPSVAGSSAPAAPAPQGAASASATWILVPVGGRVHGLRVVERGGRMSLQPGWMSRDLVNPIASIVVNDVVFTTSGGSAPATPAVLYAIDARTGKDIWNSGKTIESAATGPGFWSSNSQVYVAADDGTVYAFGYTLERR